MIPGLATIDSVKPRSTQRKNSAVTRTSQSAGRSDYRALSGGIAAVLAEQICQTVSGKFSCTEISQTLSAEFVICGTASHKSAATRKLPTASAKSPVPISATLSRKSTGESQRDSASKPKVARNELPWVSASHVNNPNGVAAQRENRGTTPLGLKTFTTSTQGSSCLATLGWMTQSRWDCRSQKTSRSASDPLLEINQQAARTRK